MHPCGARFPPNPMCEGAMESEGCSNGKACALDTKCLRMMMMMLLMMMIMMTVMMIMMTCYIKFPVCLTLFSKLSKL